ncbi:hypothetical protein EDB89DRAFT_1945994 [Lactarius sanguifluus]|nr:hypothetical protein EDB89DRAFT_1945994 [Lactarius sanguifluus]
MSTIYMDLVALGALLWQGGDPVCALGPWGGEGSMGHHASWEGMTTCRHDFFRGLPLTSNLQLRRIGDPSCDLWSWIYNSLQDRLDLHLGSTPRRQKVRSTGRSSQNRGDER